MIIRQEPLVIIVNENEMRISLEDNYISGEVSLYNLKGFLIKRKSIDTNVCVFDVTSFTPGIYIVVLSKATNFKIRKVIIP